jgi:hypothetical protein
MIVCRPTGVNPPAKEPSSPPEQNLLLATLTSLKVLAHPSVGGRYIEVMGIPRRHVFACPLCPAPAPQGRVPSVEVQGPWGTQIQLRPSCGHSPQEIISHVGLDPDQVLYSGSPYLPGILPLSPGTTKASRTDYNYDWLPTDCQQVSRLYAFVRQIPKDGNREETWKAAARVVYEHLQPWLKDAEKVIPKPLEVLVKGFERDGLKEDLPAFREFWAQYQGYAKTEDVFNQKKAAAEKIGLVYEPVSDSVGPMHKWLVEGVLVEGEPAISGGPKKKLKTGLALDLAVSLASGTHFLGKFPVPEPVRVAVFNGESGRATVEETIKRVVKSKGLGAIPSNLFPFYGLPQLTSDHHLNAFQFTLERYQIRVAIIDPVYLCLSTAGVINPANIFEMGQLLAKVTSTCRKAGATPLLVHHTVKDIKVGHLVQLEDLSFSGFAEFARQWFLVNDRKPWDPDKGFSRLVINYGGSAGHSGVMAVDVDEGKMSSDFTGRTWNLTVSSVAEARVRDAERREERAIRKEESSRNLRWGKVAAALARLGVQVEGREGYSRVKEAAGMSGTTFKGAVKEMEEEGILALVDGKFKGKGRKEIKRLK